MPGALLPSAHQLTDLIISNRREGRGKRFHVWALKGSDANSFVLTRLTGGEVASLMF